MTTDLTFITNENDESLLRHFFFDEICLPIGEMTDAYETFIHRIILKLLGYPGTYIDRSSKGFPDINIDKPMLGTRIET